jgi:hypothetical protein
MIVVITVGVFVGGGIGASPLSTNPFAPAGWVNVDYADAELSVPPTWSIQPAQVCEAFGAVPGLIYFGQYGGPSVSCATDVPIRGESEVTLGPIASTGNAGHRSTLNGITVWEASSYGTEYIQVPVLGVMIAANGPAAMRVVDTLISP